MMETMTIKALFEMFIPDGLEQKIELSPVERNNINKTCRKFLTEPDDPDVIEEFVNILSSFTRYSIWREKNS